ncbi:MAG: hypothetical protein AAF990_11415 [Bacteroidota bacterium]
MQPKIISFYQQLSVYIGLLLLLASAPMTAQTTNANVHCSAHFDKPFYASGEVIWYKLYLPRAMQNKEVALQISLSNGQQQRYHYLQNKSSDQVSGYIKIPYDWSTGYYFFSVVASQTTDNRQVQLLQVPLSIYSDLSEETKSETQTTDQSQDQLLSPTQPSAVPSQVEITLEKETFKIEETVVANIGIKDAKGQPLIADLSISVRDIELIPNDEKIGQNLFLGEQIPKTTIEQLHPDLRLYGQVTDEEYKGMSVPIFCAYLPAVDSFLYCKTGEDGSFAMDLPAFEGAQNLQFLNYEPKPIKVKLQKMASGEAAQPSVTPSIARYLSESRKRKNIYQSFLAQEVPITANPAPIQRSQIQPHQSLRISDYDPFPDLPTFFKEIYTPLKIRQQKDGQYNARMFGPEEYIRRFLPGSPLYIIDGQLTRNTKFFTDLRIDKVEKIDLHCFLVDIKKGYGPVGFSGVVNVTTNNKRLTVPEADLEDVFEIEGLLPAVAFPVAPSDASSTCPDFRPQLYWEPSLSTDANGRAEIRFRQSDDVSTFVIEVVGRTADGQMVRGEQRYEVVH